MASEIRGGDGGSPVASPVPSGGWRSREEREIEKSTQNQKEL